MGNLATFEDIIRAKNQRDKDKLVVKEIEIPSLKKKLRFRRPGDDMIFQIFDEISEETKTEDIAREYRKVLYLTCDTLQDPELHKELGVKDPFDTVAVFMDGNDILTVGDAVCNMNSMYKNVEEKIKN